MMKGSVNIGLLMLTLAGCSGGVGELGSDAVSYKFGATVAVNPTQPLPNRRVSFNLEVTSASNRPVNADITLKVVSKENETMYESVWADVYFHESEVWNLTQGFLPHADAARKPWAVRILVKHRNSNEVLFNESIATLDFKKK